MTSTAIECPDLDQTRGRGRGLPSVNAPGVYLKIGSFDPAFNRGPAFNRENMVMCKGLYGVCLLNLFESLGDLGTSSQYSRRPCGIQPVYQPCSSIKLRSP